MAYQQIYMAAHLLHFIVVSAGIKEFQHEEHLTESLSCLMSVGHHHRLDVLHEVLVLDGHFKAAHRALERRLVQSLLRNGIQAGLADQDTFNDFEPVPALGADNCINLCHRSNLYGVALQMYEKDLTFAYGSEVSP